MPYLAKATVSIVIKTYFLFRLLLRDEYQLRDKTDFYRENGIMRVNERESLKLGRSTSIYILRKMFYVMLTKKCLIMCVKYRNARCSTFEVSHVFYLYAELLFKAENSLDSRRNVEETREAELNIRNYAFQHIFKVFQH